MDSTSTLAMFWISKVCRFLAMSSLLLRQSLHCCRLEKRNIVDCALRRLLNKDSKIELDRRVWAPGELTAFSPRMTGFFPHKLQSDI